MVLAEKYPSEIQAILVKYPDQRSAVLPLMYLAQLSVYWALGRAVSWLFGFMGSS